MNVHSDIILATMLVDTIDLRYFLFLKDAQYQQITNELAEKSKKVEKEGAVMEM